MNQHLSILHLEDESCDAAVVRSNLEKAGLDCVITRVENHADFVEALRAGKVDLILADNQLPGFSGQSALKLARELCPEVPFIFVTGTLGEERAVECLHNGATDYVLKDRLSRLVPAVRRALREAEDRAARKKAEEQFVQAQKMEVIGQLAGSVAHDFNNILSVILCYNEVVLGALGPGHPARADAEEIKHAAERAVGLTRQLLSFSRKQVIRVETLDLNQVLAGFNNILTRLVDENVELTVILGKDLGTVQSDSGYIGQILMNLVINARDAMPQGGKLTLETGNVTLDPPAGSAAPRGNYVRLSVTDTGVGMTEAVKAHIFEPFFTTKNKGTGLGLATCMSIVKQCGGHIEVRSEAGQGATFDVCFPRGGPSSAAAVFSRGSDPLPRGNETVLLVEDEPSVRHLAAGILRSLGYQVLAAANGQEGLHTARDHQGTPIRLVITDVVMPLMGGKVMAEWLQASYPGLKVLYTSGYTEEAIARHGALEPGVEFLPKPYTPSSLSQKVRMILDAK